MTNRGENQQNSSISFKIRLVKRPETEVLWKNNRKLSQRLYQQLNNANKVTYNPGSFSLDLIKGAIGDLYKKELNEYRKAFSFRSEIFKQTYKFGQ